MPYGYYPQTKLERKALGVASYAHNGQMRKCLDNTPYIVHPIDVALRLQKSGASSLTVAAGLLHDVQEKAFTRYPRQRMRQDFGHDITRLVGLVSKNPSKKDWHLRNDEFADTMRTTDDLRALEIIGADKDSNLADILRDYQNLGEGLWDYFNSDREDQLGWYKTIQGIMAERIPDNPLTIDLGKQVVALEAIVASN